MSDKSRIEWTDASWNPVVGCTKVSSGCANCYAIRYAHRLGAISSPARDIYRGLADSPDRWSGQVKTLPDRLMDPTRWRKPRRVFVCSMSDLFHEDVPFDFIDRVMAVIQATPRHQFQVLTKRADRMRNYFAGGAGTAAADPAGHARHGAIFATEQDMNLVGDNVDDFASWPLPNLWLGISAENQAALDDRLLDLINTPAAVRFVSCEPLLGPVSLIEACSRGRHGQHRAINALTGDFYDVRSGEVIAGPRAHQGPLDWVIAGGESGPRARPSEREWFDSLQAQCAASRVPFFFKQWGEWIDNGDFVRVGKKAAGRLLGGREYNEMPEPSRV